RVKAVDADEGQNAVVHYRIIPESLPRAEFIIDAVRGDLMVNKPLDFEASRNYTFTVAATDYGTPQLQSIQQVAARGTPLLRFEVDDADCIENAASIFGIEEGYGVFGITPTSGELYVSSPLDFESQSHYNITVFAKNIAGGEKSFK
ncbi:cadherin domain protein, partial [Teladorsagia circumcincta]